MPSARARRIADYPIVDVDVHLHELPGELIPYAEMPLRRALEQGAKAQERWLDTPGYSSWTAYDPPQGDAPESVTHRIVSRELLRADLDARGVDVAVAFTGRLIRLASTRDARAAVQTAQAYNRWLQEKWVDPTSGVYAAILVPSQDPSVAAREIETYGGIPGFAAVCLPTPSVYPLWGDATYDPIYEAAQSLGLPVVLENVTTISSVFPYELERMETALAKQTLSQPFGAMANLVSLVTSGTLARFPDLKVVLPGVGFAWLPALEWRLDRQYQYLRAEVPFMPEPPSVSIRRQVSVTTNALDVPDTQAFETCLQLLGGPDQVLFASDWPHYDADSPEQIVKWDIPGDWKRKLLFENALRVFQLNGLSES